MYAKTLLSTVAVAAAIGFAAAAAPATSAPASSNLDQVSVQVRLGDLNLGSNAGAEIALRRIHNAARSICGGAPNVRELDRAAPYADCMNRSVGQAVISLDSPLVTALNAKTAQPTLLAAGR
jgi:UrcA family protein